MTYTLWSRGRLLGQSDLGYVRCLPKHRTGDFYPTELGETLMPIATGAVPAAIELSKAHKPSGDVGGVADPDGSPLPVNGRWATELADFSAACDQRDALQLELRRPDGSIVPTEWIDIRDTEYLQSLVDEDDLDLDFDEFGLDPSTDDDPALTAAIDADIATLRSWGLLGGDEGDDAFEDDFGRGWEAPDDYAFPRYQIQVQLLDEGAIP